MATDFSLSRDYPLSVDRKVTESGDDMMIQNTNPLGSIILKLGTATAATDFQVQDSVGASIFTVDGAGLNLIGDNNIFAVGTGSDLQIVHDGADTTITSSTGDLIIDNTNVAGSTIIQLGTDTAATDFQVQNNAGASLVTVEGIGAITVPGIINLSPAATAGIVQQGTYNSAGGAAAITPAQLISGYTYVGNAGAGVALTLPGAAATAAELLARGVTVTAGMRMPPICIEVSDLQILTITAAAAADETIHGFAGITNQAVHVNYVFSSAGTADIFIIQ